MDNPALPAVSGDVFALGVAVSPADNRWENGTSALRNNLKLSSPFLSFDYTTNQASDSVLRLGMAMGPWQGFSIGYLRDDVRTAGTRETLQHFGAIYRPFDILSAAVTVDNAFSPTRLWGAGLAVRPLTAFWARADWLTLTTDASWSGTSLTWERMGGRLSWQGSDLRVWYEPGSALPGFEVTLGLGPSESTLNPVFVGQAVRWSTRTPDVTVFGAKILRIRDPGTLAASPRPQGPFGGPPTRDLAGMVALLNRAAQDPGVKAVAFEEPPVVGGLASAESLRQALERVQKAGKKVYIHAQDYPDSQGFQGWIASADRLSLNPTGTLWLKASGARRLYLKDFFDKIGVKFVNFAPWETKSANNFLTFSSMPEAERAMLKRFLTDRDALASDALKAGRGTRLKGEAAELVARGPWLVGKETLELGLVDALESRMAFEEFLTKEIPGAQLVDTLPEPRFEGWGPSITSRTVALVHLAGDIVLGPGEAGRSIGQAAAEALRDLRNDGSIRAVVIRVDSPGGAVTPSDVLAEEVKKTVAAGKPVLVVMGDLAASGGYYLSAPATRIFAQPGTLTGSIGVTAALFTGEKALELLGIHADGVDVAASSSFGDWTRNLSGADGKKWSGLIEATYDRFLDVVAEGRHIDKAKLEPLARGQIYTGREALALGLVDELGGQAEAQAWLERELAGPVEFREWIPGETNPWSGLLGPLAHSAMKASDTPTLKMAATLDPLVAPWAEAVSGVAARGPGALVWVEAP